MAIASGHRRSALRALPAAPGHIRWDGGALWYRTPHMWLRIRRLLLSLSRFSYPASLGTLIGVRRQGLVSWSTFRVLRTGGRATSFSFARGSLFPPHSRECHFEVVCGCYPRSWPLGAVARGYASCTRHQEHQTRPGRCLRGFFRWGDQAAYWQSPNSSSPLYFRDVPSRRAVFFLCSPAGVRHFPVNPIHCPLWGSRSQASRTFSVWV